MPLIVHQPTLKHYVDLFDQTNFLLWTYNTLLVAVVTTVVSVVLGVMIAWTPSCLTMRHTRMTTSGAARFPERQPGIPLATSLGRQFSHRHLISPDKYHRQVVPPHVSERTIEHYLASGASEFSRSLDGADAGGVNASTAGDKPPPFTRNSEPVASRSAGRIWARRNGDRWRAGGGWGLGPGDPILPIITIRSNATKTGTACRSSFHRRSCQRPPPPRRPPCSGFRQGESHHEPPTVDGQGLAGETDPAPIHGCECLTGVYVYLHIDRCPTRRCSGWARREETFERFLETRGDSPVFSSGVSSRDWTQQTGGR